MSAPSYIELDLVADPDYLADLARQWLEAAVPGYQWEESQVETLLAHAFAYIGSEIVDQVAQVPPVLFAYLGRWLLGIEPAEEQAATGTATIAFDSSGLTAGIPAGWEIMLARPDGTTTSVLTVDTVTAPVGGGVVAVAVVSQNPGVADNGAAGEGDPIEPLDGIATVAVTALAGGADAEDDDDYLDRLARRMALLSPRPILPVDYALAAAQVTGVGRSVALDLYQPSTSEQAVGTPVDATSHTGVAGAITTVITAPLGVAPSAALKQAVWASLAVNRVLNTVPYVMGPAYNEISVQLTAIAYPGEDREQVQAAVEASLTQWLSPATWGARDDGTGSDWTNIRTVRLSEAIDWANRPVSVSYVDQATVKLRIAQSAWTAADLVMTGVVPLPLFIAAEVTVLLSSEATP